MVRVVRVLWRLIKECFARAALVMTVVSLVLGALAGLLAAQNVHLTDQYWTNVAILTVVGGIAGFVVDVLFISPIRLMLAAEAALAAAQPVPAPFTVTKTRTTFKAEGLTGLTGEQQVEVVRLASGSGSLGGETFEPGAQPEGGAPEAGGVDAA